MVGKSTWAAALALAMRISFAGAAGRAAAPAASAAACMQGHPETTRTIAAALSHVRKQGEWNTTHLQGGRPGAGRPECQAPKGRRALVAALFRAWRPATVTQHTEEMENLFDVCNEACLIRCDFRPQRERRNLVCPCVLRAIRN